MHPEELLTQLKAAADARKVKSLDIVHAICREQVERGSSDFSVATIARLSVERGGPAAQTIHNKTGDAFKGLIKAWADHAGGLLKKPAKAIENPMQAVLAKIQDPAVRAVMGAVLAENKSLKNEVRLLKAHTNIVIDRRGQVGQIPSSTPVQILPARHGLTEIEIEALRDAISHRHMEDEGWTEDGHGRILNDKGRAVFKVGYVTGIRRIVG